MTSMNPAPQPHAAPPGWHYVIAGEKRGPVPAAAFVDLARQGAVTGATLVWAPGMPEWAPLSMVPQLAGLMGAMPPTSAGPRPVAAAEESDAVTRMLVPVGRSPWAIAAGYLGLLSILLLPAPFAIGCGIMAIRHIRRDPNLHGLGRAWFGIVMGSLALLFAGVAIIIGATK